MGNEKKIQKSLKENPEILDKVLNGLDRFASIKKEDIPNFDEVYGDIIKEHLESVENREITKQKTKSIFFKKAFYVPVSICIVLGIFISTPTGHAFAKNIYQTIVQWFDSEVNISHGKSDLIVETDGSNSTYYKSIQDVRDATNEKIAWNTENSIKDDILVKKHGDELRIVTKYSIQKYSTQKYSEITITQIIIEEETEWNTNISSNGGTEIDMTMPNGTHFIGYANDNYCYAINYQNNACIEVFSEDSDYDTFIAFIKGIK